MYNSSDSAERAELHQALALLTEVLNARTLTNVPPENLTENREFMLLREILLDFREFLMAVSMGDLSRSLHTKGYLAGALKALHSALRHLTWQTGMIASGDFSQRVDFMGEFSAAFNRMVVQLDDSHRQLREQAEELDRSNRMIMDSIRYAEMIQASLLPSPQELSGSLATVIKVYKPRDLVGGDFLFFRQTANGFVLAIIDCTGHGVPGAMMTMTVNAALGAIAARRQMTDPAVMLEMLNHDFKAVAQRHDGEEHIDNGLDIGLCIFDSSERLLSFAGAKLDLMVARRGGGAVTTFKGDRKAIGYRRTSAEFRYTRHDLPVYDDQLFCMSTDGLLDQPGGEQGFPFGTTRYTALVQDLAGGTGASGTVRCDRVITEWMGNQCQRDDITLLAFSPRLTGG